MDNTTLILVAVGAGVAYYLYTKNSDPTQQKPDMSTTTSPPLNITGVTNYDTSTGQTTSTASGFGKPVDNPVVVAVPPEVSHKSSPHIIPGSIQKAFRPLTKLF
jgi:hypothetical protein